MKKIFFIFLGFFVFSPAAFASVESTQIITFQWDKKIKRLKPVSTGSGTAIDRNLVLTNKHVVAVGENDVADFILLCPAKQRSTRAVECNVPAVVISVHDKFDAALIKPISKKVFFPHVRLTNRIQKLGDRIRIEGFPVAAIQGLQNFGGNQTYQKVKEWVQKGGTLKIGGDKLTITRGKITGAGTLKSTGGQYFLTNSKVNFGNSGGAAFNAFGEFIGIPTLRDKEFNALILKYDQLGQWVADNKDKNPEISPEVLTFYNRNTNPKNVIKTKERRGRTYISKTSKSKVSSKRKTKSRRSYYPKKRSTKRSTKSSKKYTTKIRNKRYSYAPRKKTTIKKKRRVNTYRSRGRTYTYRRRR